jgi:hypothetical protein
MQRFLLPFQLEKTLEKKANLDKSAENLLFGTWYSSLLGL